MSESSTQSEETPSLLQPANAATAASNDSNKRGASYLTTEQQAFLEKRLQNRPDHASLKADNIIKDGGRLAAVKERLEKELKQDAVGRAIDNRSSVAALTNSNILQGSTVAPRLQNAKIRLEHAITRDHIGQLLESRPELKDVINSGVMQAAPVAAGLQRVQRQLAHSMTVDRVGHLLEQRSERDELKNLNILKDSNKVAPAIQGPQRTLQRALAKSNLFHALLNRPSVSELSQRGVYVDVDEQQQQSADPQDLQQQSQLSQQQWDQQQQLLQQQFYDQQQQQQQQQQYYDQQQQQPSSQQWDSKQQDGNQVPSTGGYQRRSKNFHLTRILLKYVAAMAEAAELSLQQKGYLKDLIVDQDATILSVAETFDQDNDLAEFKDSLCRLTERR